MSIPIVRSAGARFGALVLILASSAALAGCFAPSGPGVPAPSVGAARTYAYACAGADACPRVVADPTGRSLEPYAAAHPGNADVFAVMSAQIPGGRGAAAGAPDGRARATSATLQVTEDGGATWRLADVPAPKREPSAMEPADFFGDPVVLFTPEGRLHVLGLWWSGGAEAGVVSLGFSGRPKTWHLYSDDLGRSFSEPRLLDAEGGFQDREWLVRDPASGALYATWQYDSARPVEERRTAVWWSLDDGETWEGLADGAAPACYRGGRGAALDGRLVFACEVARGEARGVAVYSFRAGEATPTLLSELPGLGELPQVTALADGRLALTRDACFWGAPDCAMSSTLSFSADGGRTWSPEEPIASRIEGDPPTASRAFWTEADDFGGLHLLVWSARDDATAGPAGDATGVRLRERALHHVVVDAQGGTAHAAALDAWRDREQPVGLVLVGPERNVGDFFGVAWSGASGLVAWTVDGALKVQGVEARPSSP